MESDSPPTLEARLLQTLVSDCLDEVTNDTGLSECDGKERRADEATKESTSNHDGTVSPVQGIPFVPPNRPEAEEAPKFIPISEAAPALIDDDERTEYTEYSATTLFAPPVASSSSANDIILRKLRTHEEPM